MAFEELDGSFVLLGRLARGERSEISAMTGLGVYLPGIEAIFPRWQLDGLPVLLLQIHKALFSRCI
jgi:hypothetical protein